MLIVLIQHKWLKCSLCRKTFNSKRELIMLQTIKQIFKAYCGMFKYCTKSNGFNQIGGIASFDLNMPSGIPAIK